MIMSFFAALFGTPDSAVFFFMRYHVRRFEMNER
jgi:hypothetical protein